MSFDHQETNQHHHQQQQLRLQQQLDHYLQRKQLFPQINKPFQNYYKSQVSNFKQEIHSNLYEKYIDHFYEAQRRLLSFLNYFKNQFSLVQNCKSSTIGFDLFTYRLQLKLDQLIKSVDDNLVLAGSSVLSEIQSSINRLFQSPPPSPPSPSSSPLPIQPTEKSSFEQWQPNDLNFYLIDVDYEILNFFQTLKQLENNNCLVKSTINDRDLIFQLQTCEFVKKVVFDIKSRQSIHIIYFVINQKSKHFGFNLQLTLVNQLHFDIKELEYFFRPLVSQSFLPLNHEFFNVIKFNDPTPISLIQLTIQFKIGYEGFNRIQKYFDRGFVFSLNSNDNCCFCESNFDQYELDQIDLFGCGHFFHDKCFDSSNFNLVDFCHQKCPICRCQLNELDYCNQVDGLDQKLLNNESGRWKIAFYQSVKQQLKSLLSLTQTTSNFPKLQLKDFQIRQAPSR